MSRTPTRDRLFPDTRIGDYRIEQELGAEETGIVYLATHVVLPRKAALKVMHSDALPERLLAVRVLREACLLEALSHPGIPRVFECGILPDRRPWTASEHIDGVTIGSMLANAPLSISDLARMLRDVGDLLAYAHARGVVHRRLTTDAIVWTPDRSHAVCVRRWGDALTLDTEAHVEVDARNDVHALGGVAFRALTGSRPDHGMSAADRCPAAPPDLTALIDQMLATDPGSRPPSDEVRDRARWIADSFEARISQRMRWTPPLGVRTAAVRVDPDNVHAFPIRIGRLRR